MRSLLSCCGLLLWLALLHGVAGASATVVSTSVVVGDSVNYTVTLLNQTQVTQVTVDFTNWTNSSTNPFSTNTQMVVGSTAYTPFAIPNKIQFSLTTAVVGSTFKFTLTNMMNPSSLKPYIFNISIWNGTVLTAYTANLTCTSILNNSFPTIGYSVTVGAVSNNIQLYLNPYYALMLNSSVLKLTYDSTVLTLAVVASSAYNIFSSVAGTVVLNKFQTQSLNQISVLANITNPQAALSTTINCLFYLNDSSGTYNIQALYDTIALQPTAFTSISTVSTFNYGVLASLVVVSACPYTPASNGSTSAYNQFSYNSAQIKVQNTSNCVATSSTTCKLAYASNYTVTSLLPQIGSFNATTLTITSYTYFQSQFYPLCQSTLSLPFATQALTPSANTSQCTSAVVAQANTISVTVNVSLVAVGDLAYIKGILGVPSTTAWTATIISNATWYYYTLTSANIAAINTTTSTLTLPLSFNNPTYTVTANTITVLTLVRSAQTYAASSASISVCPVTAGLAISASSVTSSKPTTFTPTTIQSDMSMQLFDYKAGDYLVVAFKANTNGNTFLFASTYLGLTYSATINGVPASNSLVNSSAIKLTLTNATLPTSTSPLLKVVLTNLANPPMVSILWAQIASYEALSGGTKETLTTGNLSVTQNVLSYSASNLQLLANNTLTLSLANPYRNLTNSNSSVSSTSLKVTLPAQLNCTAATNNSLTISWNTGVLTSLATASGNTTNLAVYLGTCYVSYFTGTITYLLTETYSNITSTSTSLPVVNTCGDGCYQCSGAVCTACFNTTWANLSLLYGGSCYKTCPAGTFQSSSGACTACHPSCASCNGSAYTNCTACAPAFVNTTSNSSNYCLSVCGAGKYLSGSVCLSCDLQCTACLSSAVCYLCKSNATMIGSVCSFTSCFSPCLTCSAVQSNCTSCISSYSLYQFGCVSSCPSGTYQSTSDGQSVCTAIPQSSSYIPVSIVGVVGMLAIFALRVYSNKRIGNDSRRSRNYTVDDDGSINFKINVWRVGAVMFGYLEIIAAIVLLLKNMQYGLSVSGASIVTIGLIVHLLTNIAFIIGYYCIVSRNKISNSVQISEEDRNLSLRHNIILAVSAIFSYRTYKLLYANLFREQKTADLRRTEKAYPNEDSYNPVSRLTATQPNPRSSPSTLPPQRNQFKQSDILVRSKAIREQEVVSKKPLAMGVVSRQDIAAQVRPAQGCSGMEGSLLYFKRFNHPFLTYLTLSNLLVGSLLILIGSCLQMISSTFVNMLFWGVDALIVTIFSLGLSSWDLWNFANLTRQEQHSQMSSNNEANYTHQNLKQAAEVQVEMADLKPKKSPKRSMVRPKLSNRTNKSKEDSKSKQDRLEENEPIPMLKVFEDFEEKEETVMKEGKTKKFSTKNLRYGNKLSKRNASITNTRKHLGELCDDLYINFPSYNVEKENSTTSYFKSRQSGSPPQRSMREKVSSVEGEAVVVGEGVVDLEQDDFQMEQPPNFEDISEIEERKLDVNSSELVPEPL